jgi:HK97 family phage major capsid protein
MTNPAGPTLRQEKSFFEPQSTSGVPPMPDPITRAAMTIAHRAIISASDAVGLVMTREAGQQPSLVRGIESLRKGRGIEGFEREYLAELANARGIDFDPRNPTWPYSILSTRATPLAAGQSANGGYLVGAENQELIDIFRPWSVLGKAGVDYIGGLQSNAILPRMTQDVTGQWITSETVSATEAPPLLGSIATSPKTFGITVRWSRQMQLQAPNLEMSLRQICAKAAIQGVDTAALTGVGGVGLPLGLLNSQGIATQSGTSLAHAGLWTTRGTLAAANVNDEAVAWIGAPGVRTILATRERNAGDEYLWTSTDQITGRSANVTTIMPAATLVAGDWSQMCYCFYGPGFQIDVTPYNSAADFQIGNMTMRLMVSVDIILMHPSAFVSITGVT